MEKDQWFKAWAHLKPYLSKQPRKAHPHAYPKRYLDNYSALLRNTKINLIKHQIIILVAMNNAQEENVQWEAQNQI